MVACHFMVFNKPHYAQKSLIALGIFFSGCCMEKSESHTVLLLLLSMNVHKVSNIRHCAHDGVAL